MLQSSLSFCVLHPRHSSQMQSPCEVGDRTVALPNILDQETAGDTQHFSENTMWLLSRLLIGNTAQSRQAPQASCRPLPVPSEPLVLAIAGTSCRGRAGWRVVAGGYQNSSGVFSRKLGAHSLASSFPMNFWSSA